jgi:L-amino acid N-acyltransferase YncA
MKTRFGPISGDDREVVIDLLNYYVDNSFAAFPESKVPYEWFDRYMAMSEGLPTATLQDPAGHLLGFGMLRKTKPLPTFAHTAEITYFIDHKHTGRGLGTALLEFLVEAGKSRGLTTILAEISSLNERSIRFHAKNGFVECGRFKSVGKKKGQFFDTVWMQKML